MAFTHAYEARLDLLRIIYPIKGLLHVGIGTGALLERYTGWHVPSLTLVEADQDRLAAISDAISDIAGWAAHGELLAKKSGEVVFHHANNKNESGMLLPETLLPLWQNLKTVEQHPLKATTIKNLLAKNEGKDQPACINWVHIECLPALSILQGACELLESWDVVQVRALVDETLLQGQDELGKSALDVFMAKHGFEYVAHEPERHPAVGQVLYVRNWKNALQTELVSKGEEEHRQRAEFQTTIVRITSERDEQNKLVQQRDTEINKLTKAHGEQQQLAVLRGSGIEKSQQKQDAQRKQLEQLQAQAEKLTIERDEQIREHKSYADHMLEKKNEDTYRQGLIDEELTRLEVQVNLVNNLSLEALSGNRKGADSRKEKKNDNPAKKDKLSVSINVTIDARSQNDLVDLKPDIDIARLKKQWFLGDWKAFADLDVKSCAEHAECSFAILLAASAQQQLGNHEKARKYTLLALDRGCSLRRVIHVLGAGLHNTLGKIAVLRQSEDGHRHFRHAVKVDFKPDGEDIDLLAHARAMREMVAMGLLPQAAGTVTSELDKNSEKFAGYIKQKNCWSILKAEIELISHELSLAQQRQQLYSPVSGHREIPNDHDPSSPAWRKALKKCSVSQLGQDLWVLEQTNYKKNGFFVEFGATDGVLLSNSFLLEKEFAWQGICAEPNPRFLGQLKKNRSCTISSDCIGEKTGEKVEFIFAGVYGGMEKYANDDAHKDKRKTYRAVGDTSVLTTISLHDFLVRHEAPHTIDYLSIDTEGSEYDILQTVPFDRWDIRLITVEHNYTKQRQKIRKLLEGNGYTCFEQQWDDWYKKK